MENTINTGTTQRLVLASNNAGKLAEFSRLLATKGFELIPQAQLGVTEADEPFSTFVENALAKARHASLATGLPALADDSGICVPALNGAPGVYSARYASLETGEPKSDQANNALLVKNLTEFEDKRAYYYAVLVFVRHADDPQPIIAEGIWQGEVQASPAGKGGFGYDPHFYLPELGQTAAQLSAEQKNQLSHRAQALQVLLKKLSVVAS